jgi:hypothetical protein
MVVAMTEPGAVATLHATAAITMALRAVEVDVTATLVALLKHTQKVGTTMHFLVPAAQDSLLTTLLVPQAVVLAQPPR